MASKKYLIGLDAGTESVGWCVTDETGKIVRKNGKCLWGSRLFEEADSCAERRGHRDDRRRLARRKQRLELLQEILAPEIYKVDKNFFIRLNESQLHYEDKTFKTGSLLFENDSEYYDQFPTIYHLRKHLLESNSKEDIRLIYLALAHMVKYRGNFLCDGLTFNVKDDSRAIEYLNSSVESLNFITGERIDIGDDKKTLEKIISIFKNDFTIAKKKEDLGDLLNKNKNNEVKNYLQLLAGGTISTDKIISDESIEFEDVKKIYFDDENFEKNIQIISGVFADLSDKNKTIITALIYLKDLYDFLLLKKLLNDSMYLSFAMVKEYDNHQKQLRELKDYIKKNIHDKYNEVFRKYDPKIANYTAYVGSTISDKKMRVKHCDRDEFYKYIKDILGIKDVTNPDSINNAYLKSVYLSISDGSYLNRQNSSSSRLYPFQLNLEEMKIILKKQSEFYPFLKEQDARYKILNGTSLFDCANYTNADKIISLLTFKIPYFVGPLNKNSKNAWIVFNGEKKEKIYPWNFDSIIDKDKCGEQFIQRMLNKCAYLHDQYCLPKNSILFSTYVVLNEINKLDINGMPISYDDKMGLIDHVYHKYRKPTVKQIKDYILSRHNENNDIVITTSNGNGLENLTGSIMSYVDFKNIFKDKFSESNFDMYEDIIQDITIFEDKNMLEHVLTKKYKLSKEEISKIKGLSYSGFSRLSKKLLSGFTVDAFDENGEVIPTDSIINLLRNTNLNLMEILNNKEYGFSEAIQLYNQNEMDEYKGNDGIKNYVDNLYVSPGIKRTLIQSYKIIEEVERILKAPIDEYYIECNRSNKAKKGKINSRKLKILALYKEAENLSRNLDIHNKVDALITKAKMLEEDKFKSDAVFLYFTQLGKDMYTGKDIELESLKDYDIDHIFPQTAIKDDSLDNRVLTLSKLNSDKRDVYPIPYSKISGDFDHVSFHKLLNKLGLISDVKLDRLTRTYELTDDEIYNFVSRQIEYTSQIEKALKDLILLFKKDGKNKVPLVVMSKAENVHDFREQFSIIKCREANDFHHAHDAYLNIMVGRTLNTYFGTNIGKIKYMHEHGFTTNPLRVFINNKEKTKQNILDSDGNLVWDYAKSLSIIKKNIFENHNILVTTRTYISHSLFSKITIKPHDEINEFAWPLKSVGNKAFLNTKVYGGYTNLSFGYYSLYESLDRKNEKCFTLCAIPTILRDDKDILNYVSSRYKLNNPVKILDKLKINTVMKSSNSKFCITGATNNSFNIKNLIESFFSCDDQIIIKKIMKLDKFVSINKGIDLKTGALNDSFITKFNIDKNAKYFVLSKSKIGDGTILSTEEVNKLLEMIICHYKNKIFNFYSCYSDISNLFQNCETIEKIKNLNLFAFSYLVGELLNLTQCKRLTANLEMIGGKPNVGVLHCPSKLPNGVEILFESITGFYTKIVWKGK